jgi:hypothetical protein
MLLASYNCSFIVKASVITIVNYDCKTLIVEAIGGNSIILYDVTILNIEAHRIAALSLMSFGITVDCRGTL